MITIEKKKYDEFRQQFAAGKYGKQRLGQAFFNEFRLDRTRENTYDIWSKDGTHAVRCIESFCQFI